MYTLYSWKNSYSMTAQVGLEELGLDYQLNWTTIHIPMNEKSADFIQANPNGRVPTLITPDGSIYEADAILIYLAERHPVSDLMPTISSPLRRLFWQWHFYLTNTFQPEEQIQSDASVYLPDNKSGQNQLKQVSMDRLRHIWSVLNDGIMGPYFLGEQYTTCDISFAMQAHWPECQPPEGLSNYPKARECLKRILDRSAVQKVLGVHKQKVPSL